MSNTGFRKEGVRDLPRGISGGRYIQSQDIQDYTFPAQRKVNHHHLYIEPRQTPLAMLKGATGAVASGATGAVNLLAFPGQGVLEMAQLGAGQTLVVPTIASDGLDIAGDAADNEGREFSAGLLAINPGVFIVGTDAAFFARVRYAIDDVSETDDLAIGFRKNGAYTANIDDYTDMAVLNLITGQLTAETILNNAATTSTSLGSSFAVADNSIVDLMVKVSAAGVVTYEAGHSTTLTSDPTMSAPAAALAFTFDTGDVVTPFLFFLRSSANALTVRLKRFESGFQKGSG